MSINVKIPFEFSNGIFLYLSLAAFPSSVYMTLALLFSSGKVATTCLTTCRTRTLRIRVFGLLHSVARGPMPPLLFDLGRAANEVLALKDGNRDSSDDDDDNHNLFSSVVHS